MTNVTTSDYYLACWLHAHSVPIVKHVRENNRSTFEFYGSNVDQLLTEYYNEAATTSIHPFTKAMREIKALMYSGTTIQPNNYHETRKETTT